MNPTGIRQAPQEISIANKVTKTVVLSALLTLFANTLLSDGLFSESLNSIIKFQSSATPGSVLFFNLVSFLANPIFVVVIIVAFFMIHKIRIRVMVFLSFFILNTYFMTILKAAYHEARPFWYSKSIQQLEWTCPREYGNPSGHSWLVVVLYEPLFTDFFPTHSKLTKTIKWIFLVLMCILVPFSRMYLGAHSGNQVFFGLLMGVSMVVLYRFCIQKHLYLLYQHLLRVSQSTDGKLRTLLLVFLTQGAFVLVPIIIYIYAPTEDFQYILILNEKCPDRITTSIGLNGGILFTSMLISLQFGLIYGLLYCSQQTLLYIYGKWEFKTGRPMYQTRALKYVIQLSLLAGPLVVLLILEQLVEGVATKYFIFSGLITLSGYLFMSYSWRVLKHYEIVGPVEKSQSLL